MRKSGRKQYGFLITAGLWIMILCCSLLVPAAAAESDFSLSVTCEADGVKLSDMTWQIYCVGSRNSDGTYKLEGDFSSYAVDTSNLKTTSDVQDCANTLETFALLDNLPALAASNTDSSGIVTFTDLSAGLYLLSGSSVTVDGKRYTPSPILMELSDSDGTLDWSIQPKFTVSASSEVVETYTVKKIWQNDEDALENRAVTLQVGIYKDSDLAETVTLSEENDWTYQWEGDSSYTWSVKEIDIPTGYTVVYRWNETQYLIINTLESETSSTETTTQTASGTSSNETQTVTASGSKSTSDDSSGKLPQTGQLWWPVPILAAAGIICIIVGCRLRHRS